MSDPTPRETEFLHQALALERQGHQFLMEQKNELAFEAYKSAARIYREIGRNEQAGHCFKNASSCWNKHIGQQPLYRAAQTSEEAAHDFVKAGDYESAISAYVDAAILYEKDGDFSKFSACYYDAKRLKGRQEWRHFKNTMGGWKPRLISLFRWLINMHSRLIWGYGEKPFRTFCFALCLMICCALSYYALQGISVLGHIKHVNFWEAFYFSAITFATVGYGDYLPATSLARAFAILESFSGITIIPLFLISLTRRYLRTTT